MNSKVNNWAVELESQNITFKYIPGIRNTSADTLSRLIEMDEDIKLQPEEEGKEFGYFPFKELPPVTTQVIEEVIECEIGNINLQHTDPVQIDIEITLPIVVIEYELHRVGQFGMCLLLEFSRRLYKWSVSW